MNERKEAVFGDLAPELPRKQRRGFAAMDPAKQREIAARGGRASHERGTGHEWTSAEAREAGRKGGAASHRNRRFNNEAAQGELPEVKK